jgi:Sec-independent protein secretion pathway component TatC
LPIIIKSSLISEKQIKQFPQYWRLVTLGIVIISGFLTPTIDGYTQISFSLSASFIYYFLIIFLKKRANFKSRESTFFGF